ncbi:hypothetical protein PUR59_30495 [Streptomyces sp. SP18ES09]|uniref:hypothetical protein n=1 Tax=Streptomyces sp. SP18ES09 TaxID=3002532 RepID=UPI002E76DCA6|nr:hypothetical protein [Streptomyces sp. SP18ES09]MEE1819331.1 hypothetical protein [Streptomyces sp. SP18ES09]
MTVPAQFIRSAALITSAALRDDDTTVHLLLHTLPPEEIAATAEGAILAMAELLRDAVTPQAIQNAIREAQSLAHEAAIEGDQS